MDLRAARSARALLALCVPLCVSPSLARVACADPTGTQAELESAQAEAPDPAAQAAAGVAPAEAAGAAASVAPLAGAVDPEAPLPDVILDAVVLRPFRAAKFVMGFGMFFASLPLYAVSWQLSEPWGYLVQGPFEEAFRTPLGRL